MVCQSIESFTIRHSGVYRNLPTFPNAEGLTAIVPGAAGISDWNTVRSLLDSLNRWNKVYAIPRGPPKKELMDIGSIEQQSRLQHSSVDFSGLSQDIAKSLSSIEEIDTYVFFYAYL
jgi:hypothetical protein